MEIDPTNYKIAVSQAEASVQSAQANVQNIDAQIDVQQAQISNSPRLQRCLQEKRSGLLQYPWSHWNRGRLAS
jgi:multidrug resistance efflux pump